MRLLSFLTQIEHAVLQGPNSTENGTWETSRIVNFHHGFARLTFTPRAGADAPVPSGTIFLQVFTLANGSTCVKVSLAWAGSDECPVFAVYSSPTLDWKQEANRIGSAWLKGAHHEQVPTSTPIPAPQLLKAG